MAKVIDFGIDSKAKLINLTEEESDNLEKNILKSIAIVRSDDDKEAILLSKAFKK